MLLSADQLTALLTSLGLTQSIFKPIPDLVGGLLGTVDGLVGTVDGITAGTGLPIPAISSLPIIGQILEATPESEAAASSFVVNDPQSLDTTLPACVVEPYDPPAVFAQTFAPFDEAQANVFRYRQQQSVNLGSWFVHEQWMTPSLFTCAAGPQIAEIDIASGWGNTTSARAVLERHWDSFIGQSDFQYLASIGINTVRLPIGYWSLGPSYCQGTPFEPVADVYTNSWTRVVRAINMAAESGLGVLVDLHGAPGSQNGQPHSGISDGMANLFNDPANIQKTMDVLTFLVQQLATVTNVVGIQLLNEPQDVPELSDFYTQAITTLRQDSTEAAALPLYIHDAFDLQRFSDFVANRTDFVVQDHHSYFVFTPSDDTESASAHANDVQSSLADQLAAAASNQRGNLIIGEWSCALTPDSLANTSDPLTARRLFCESQEQVYTNTTAGWGFWSYQTEDCDTNLDWCFKSAVGNTLPSTFFSYGNAPMTSPSQLMDVAVAVADMDMPSMTEVLGLAGVQNASTSLMTSNDPTTTSDANSTASSDDAMSTTTPGFSSSSTQGSSASSAVVSKRRSSQQHRFDAIHARRHSPFSASSHKRDVANPVLDDTAAQRSITKGYSDGFLTAKIFAQYGMSKLGFTGQYIADSITALGPTVIEAGSEGYYSDWFSKGLSDGQAIVSAAANI